MKLNNATDLSAKLLATENISIRRARTQTASFDIVSRVLTLPMWKEMTPQIEQMLVGHEVGHALWTENEYMEPIKENPKMMSYLNILEDVRIEKKLKRRYPGIRKTMNEGYKQLNDKDFFGVKSNTLESLILIDKINLYYKAGYQCGVTFTPEEKLFVNRAEHTETIEDVIALAKEIYEYSREEMTKRIKEMEQEATTSSEEDLDDLEEEDENFDMDPNSSQEDEDDETPQDGKESTLGRTPQPTKKSLEEKLDEELESSTDKIFSKKLEELSDDKTEFFYYKLDDKYAYDPVINYKRVLAETAECEEHIDDRKRQLVSDFKTDASRVVNYLVKEFEMKKSATLYKRAQTSKIGSLDMKKIWGYKLNEDLFKRITTIPQGKNHGMIFLLDWSGSMDHVMEDTIKQVASLAMFCHRIQIPYQVFAFTSQYPIINTVETRDAVRSHEKELRDSVAEVSILNNATSEFALLELMSNKMSNVEFNSIIRRMINFYDFRQCKNHAYGTSGTPLNEALGYLVKHIPNFIKSNNIEKMSLITLTDGEGCGLSPVSRGRYGLEPTRNQIIDNEYKRIEQKHFLIDPITKKTYEITRYGSQQTQSILNLIRDRYGVKSIGFHICRNNRRDLIHAITSNIPNFNGNQYLMVDNMRKDFRVKGFTSVKSIGRDDMFLIPQNSLRVDDSNLDVNEKQTAKQIARSFSKHLNNKKTSRVLLNQFIGYVA